MYQQHLPVRKRRQLHFLAPLVALAFALLLASPASAAIITNITQPYNNTSLNPCNGESVTFSGQIHTLSHRTVDSSGGVHSVIHYNLRASGVGSLGNHYRINTKQNLSFNTQLGHKTTFIITNRVISEGAAPNFLSFLTLSQTSYADGTLIIQHSDMGSECQG